jgi:hypothetical protein
LPMLKQLQETKHGAPIVDDDDVPKELHITKKEQAAFDKARRRFTSGDKFFKRWDWILNEMVWAFEQKTRDHWEDDFEWEDDKGRKAHQERMTNGFKLFGKYYENLWD